MDLSGWPDPAGFKVLTLNKQATRSTCATQLPPDASIYRTADPVMVNDERIPKPNYLQLASLHGQAK